MLPDKIYNSRNGLYLLNLYLKCPYGTFQTSQVIIKAIGCFLQPDGKALLLRMYELIETVVAQDLHKFKQDKNPRMQKGK